MAAGINYVPVFHIASLPQNHPWKIVCFENTKPLLVSAGVLGLFLKDALDMREPKEFEEYEKPAGHSEMTARIIAHIVLLTGKIVSLPQCVFCIAENDKHRLVLNAHFVLFNLTWQ